VFFHLPVIMLMLITLLNDGTLITIGYDTVQPSKLPEKWNLKVLFTISIVLAGVAMASSLLLLWAALDSGNPNGAMQHAFGLPEMTYGQVVLSIYMKVSISDFLTLFSARTNGFFFTQKPGPLLFAGGCFALSVSTILSCVWPIGSIDQIPVEGLAMGDYKLWPLWIWIYCLIWWGIQDTAKVLSYKFIFAVGLFGATKGTAIDEDEISNASKYDAQAMIEMDRLAREGKKKPTATQAAAPAPASKEEVQPHGSNAV